MNLISHLTIQKVLASPRQNIIYLANDGTRDYIIKAARQNSPALLEAYEDEYETLKQISHPVLPRYYAMIPDFRIAGESSPVPALCMEYINGTPFLSIDYLTTKQLKKYILDLGDSLLLLLSKGVLYTDLHPGNLMIANNQMKLLDFTCAYYFLKNPYPSYVPKISYHLNQNLKGQQLLSQALSFLLIHLPDRFSIQGIPDSLLEMGQNPHNGLLFSDFLKELDREWKTD